MKISFVTLVLFFVTLTISGQPPQAFKYQFVIRDNNGDIMANQTVDIRISIHDASPSGTVVYQETVNTSSNQFGMVNLEIGNGSPTIGTFSGIDWSSGPKFLETEVDISGSGSYISMGTTELLSVPYALAAGDDGDWTKLGNDIYTSVSGNVGIGTSMPYGKLHAVGGNNTGIFGSSNSSYGIIGESDASGYSGVMGKALTSNSIGLYGQNLHGGTALYAHSIGGLAGHFDGNVYVEDGLSIGIANAISCRLHLYGSDNYSGVMRLENSGPGGNAFFMGPTTDNWSSGGDKFIIGHGSPAGGNYILTMLKSGEIGIGTPNPQNLFEVAGTALFGNINKGIRLRNTGQLVDIESIGTGLALNYQTGNNTIMNVVSGKVGIGTDSPYYKLDVHSSSYAIYGHSSQSIGVHGHSSTNVGVYAQSSSGTGLYGQSITGNAGYFSGNVHVTGSLSKGAGSFLIDHPQDPENKLLRHNFVESPENLVIYRGKADLNNEGEVVVQLPDYFKALTKEKDASIHITPVGKPFLTGAEWNKDFSAIILYGESNRQVFWEVLSDRDDPVIHELGMPVEEEKGPDNKLCDKGQLLYPKAYGYPESMSNEYQHAKNKPNPSNPKNKTNPN